MTNPVTSGLVVSLQADDLVAGPLASWSNATFTAEQSDATKRPTVVANALNTHSVVRFDGSNDRLALSANPFSNASLPRTVIAVIQSDDYIGHVIGTGASAAAQVTKQGYGLGVAANKPFVKALNNGSGAWLLAADNIKQHGPQILMASVANAGTELRTACSRTTTSLQPMPADFPTAYIGGVMDGAESFQGDVAEILIYERILNAEEQNTVWLYLATKYGITTADATDTDADGIFDSCDEGAEYLKAPALTVTLEAPAALHAGVIANITDAASATVFDRHTDVTHVWAKGETVLYFDLLAVYHLRAVHFWNYNGEGYDTDNAVFSFYDSSQQLISQLTVTPAVGFEDILAEDFAVDVAGVRYVRAQLTGSNGEVEFQNIGFSGVLAGTEP